MLHRVLKQNLKFMAQCIICLCRWSSLNVSALQLRAPLTVTPTVTIQETLDILNKEGFDQVPVVNDAG